MPLLEQSPTSSERCVIICGQKVLRNLQRFITEGTRWPRFFDHDKSHRSVRRTMTVPVIIRDTWTPNRVQDVPEQRLLEVGDATNEHFARLLRDNALLELYNRVSRSGLMTDA